MHAIPVTCMDSCGMHSRGQFVCVATLAGQGMQAAEGVQHDRVARRGGVVEPLLAAGNWRRGPLGCEVVTDLVRIAKVG